MKRAIGHKVGGASTFDHMQQFSNCGFLRKDIGSGDMEPDTDAMMKHILKGSWALAKYVGVSAKEKSQKHQIFDEALSILKRLVPSDSLSSITLETFEPSSDLDEEFAWSSQDIKRLKKKGKNMISVYINESADEHFWLPLFFSLIIDNASEGLCSDVLILYEEQGLLIECIRRVDSCMLCMQLLVVSVQISDASRLLIFEVFRKKAPWLFFVKDNSKSYPLRHAARQKCSPEVVRFLLQMNPYAINAQNSSGETPLHLLLDRKYEESKHFDLFQCALSSSKQVDIELGNIQRIYPAGFGVQTL
jgi:hypothetical protein